MQKDALAPGTAGRPLIFGEVLFDRFPDGTAILGGAPFNVAWHLQAFGMEPLFISSVGADRLGEQVRSAMQEWGMDLTGLQIDSRHPTGVVDVSFHQGEPHYHIVPDSAWDYIHKEGLPLLPADGLLYHGSLALRQEVSRSSWQRLNEQSCIPSFIDINLRDPWWNIDDIGQLLTSVRWLKINADELARIVPHLPDTESRISYLVSELSLAWLIVTLGDAGALAVSADGERLQVRPQQAVQVVDTVGAGDSFSSVLILGLLKGWPMEQTLQRAQQFAAAVVGLRGATSRDRNFYQPFIEEWQIG
ncbi:MAG: carbohydrate kinase [Pseudomonadota bacterium]